MSPPHQPGQRWIQKEAVLDAITRLGKDGGISTLAEEAGTMAELEMLNAIGCDAAPGDHRGQPMTAADAATPVQGSSP